MYSVVVVIDSELHLRHLDCRPVLYSKTNIKIALVVQILGVVQQN